MRLVEDVLKLPVFDSQEKRIGNLYDISVTRSPDYPRANSIAVKIDEVETIGNYRLLEPAHDVVVAVSWDQVASFGPEKVKLASPWEELPLYAWGKDDIFLRRDILNVQVVDRHGHRVQRVDDLILEMREGHLLLAGIYIGFGARLERLNLARAAQHLLKTLGVRTHGHMLPWTSVESYGPELEEIRLNVGVDKKSRDEQRKEIGD